MLSVFVLEIIGKIMLECFTNITKTVTYMQRLMAYMLSRYLVYDDI